MKPARFVCVSDGVPEETTDLLRAACSERDVAYDEIDPRSFDFDPDRRLAPGDLLYRPAVSHVASVVEQFLYTPGVATFYGGRDRVFFSASSSLGLFQLAGLPIPRTIFCAATDRALLKSHVAQLGGLPVIAKLMGGEGGVGVMRIESLAALYSLLDFARAQGRVPHLCANVAPAVHWRVVVVGERAVAAYRNLPEPDDFRTIASDDPDDVTDAPAHDLAALAVRAVSALQLEFGGVDILQHESGRLYLLEANFPCYFPHAQTVGGIDIAGMMVDVLLAKSNK